MDFRKSAPAAKEYEMSAFVAQPIPRSNRIPTITLKELIRALSLYLPTITDYLHEYETIECERAEMFTDVSMFGQVLPDFTVAQHLVCGVRKKVIVVIRNKAARTSNAKLWSEPFAVDIYIPYPDDLHFEVMVEPRVDRSIAIHKIYSWESGKPIFD